MSSNGSSCHHCLGPCTRVGSANDLPPTIHPTPERHPIDTRSTPHPHRLHLPSTNQGPNHWSSAVWFTWLPCCSSTDGSKGWNVRHIILDDESWVNRFILFVIILNTALFAMQDATNSPEYVENLALANVVCVWFYAVELSLKLFIIGYQDTFGSAAETFGELTVPGVA